MARQARRDDEEREITPGEEETDGSRDVPFDPFLVPSSPALSRLAATIFEETERLRQASERRRKDAAERRKHAVRTTVANAAVLVSQHPQGARLSLSARKDATTRYDRARFPTDVLIKARRALEALGLLIVHPGSRGQWRTTIEPTDFLRERIAAARLEGPLEVARVDGAETIILKAKKGSRKVLIDYDDTKATRAMRAEMADINAMLSATDIRLGQDRPMVPPFLTRRFQIDSIEAPHTFDQHGRLYGGPWLNLPKTERHLLRVDGEPVVDLDFVAMFPTLAYLYAGAAVPNSDPYVGIGGLPRTAAKKALSALLSRTGSMTRLPSEIRQIVGKEWNGRNVESAIRERHPTIAHLFGTGVGLRLMFTESEIMVAVLHHLFERGIPALPFHDGLMCQESREGSARNAMARGSMQIVGVALPVARKEIIRPIA